MAEDENDDATNALIARMLAEDNSYAAAYAQPSDVSEDSDYDQAPKKKAKKGGGRAAAKGKAKAAPPPAAWVAGGAGPAPEALGGEAAEGPDRPVELTATGRRKRKDTGAVREKARGWSEAEEALFREALDLHGRNWKAGAAHVGTRDMRAFTSHAQKHFIRLCMAGQRVPRKVAESGEGYTLSGKPLDPGSSAARAYGLKPELLAKLQGLGLPGLAPTADGEAPAAEEQAPAAAAGPDGKENCEDGNGIVAPAVLACAADGAAAVEAPAAALQPAKRAKAPAAKAPKKARRADGDGAVEEDAGQRSVPGEPPEPTEYARNRPRREVALPRNQLGETSESLELLKCADFVGPPGSGAPLAQPFSVSVAQEVLLLMDLHAHLSSAEIIGLLGGSWDASTRSIQVAAAFPCARAAGSLSGTSVELDPAAEVETRALIAARGLVPVGWYHSHPIFAPKPSQKDAENQRNYQALFRCADTGLEPFLGAIVGPFDVQLPSVASAITWFVVQSRLGELSPYAVRHALQPLPGLPGPELIAQLRGVVDLLGNDIACMDLSGAWRPFEAIEGGAAIGGPLTRAEKLRAALRGDSLAMYDCMKVISGDYRGAASAFWLAFWSLQLGAHPARRYIIAAPVTVLVGVVAARFTRCRVDALRWLVLFLLCSLADFLYFRVMPLVVTARTQPWQLLVLRLAVHPAIWGVISALFSHTLQHIGPVPNLMQAVLWMWPAMYRSIYGRFLLLQLDSASSVAVLSVLLSILSVASRLCSRQGSSLAFRLLHGTRTAEAMAATSAASQIRLAEVFASTIAEHAGIVAAAAIFSIGHVSGDGLLPNARAVWVSAAWQALTTLAADGASLALDWKFHGIDYFSSWVRDMRRFLAYMLVVATLGGTLLCVQLLSLFCPEVTPAGTLLKYCDKPSLFDHMHAF
ncbi:hypothetical protein WJX81_004646 [Elliptochloris bilobata]|uniref:MPN domain-containing protein n=1 Tax=Elliptochloris bilobata TaxID=381761 RepID=A0AAW1RAV3_9CHLO